MIDALFAVVGVVLGIALGIFLLFGLQGWLREVWRRRNVARALQENGDVLLVSTRRWPAVDPAVAPTVLSACAVRCLDESRYGLALLRQVIGGEVRMVTRNVSLARDQALARLQAQARELGYDAVLNVRFETSQIIPVAVEVMVYGTGVRRAR